MKCLELTALLLAASTAPGVVAGQRAAPPAGGAGPDERRLLLLVLAEHRPTRGYALLEPETRFDGMHPDVLPDVQRELARNGVGLEAAARLLERFARLNESPVPVPVESRPENGFVVDYDHFVDVCFPALPVLVDDPPPPEGSGGGWQRLRARYAEMVGVYSVSRPAFDPRRGLALAYVEKRGQGRLVGSLYLYEVRNEALRELSRVTMRIS